jgi:uncharacterized protein YggE
MNASGSVWLAPLRRHWKLGALAAVPLLLGASMADGTTDPRYTRLTLSGEGYSEQVSEYVSVAAATQTWSSSASRAMDENARDMDRLRARLSQLGVDEADFSTADFRFQEAKDPDDDDGDRADGFAVQHRLSIMIRDTDDAGQIVDALVRAGAKNLQINRHWGYMEQIDPRALRTARGLAIRDAMTKANDYAAALGMKVRRVVSVQDRHASVSDRPMPVARVAAYADTEIETRPKTVLASVGVEFELQK